VVRLPRLVFGLREVVKYLTELMSFVSCVSMNDKDFEAKYGKSGHYSPSRKAADSDNSALHSAGDARLFDSLEQLRSSVPVPIA